MAITLNDLSQSYTEALKLISWITELKTSEKHLKLQKIQGIFSNSSLWEEQDKKSGHSKFIHKVTRVVVEFQSHCKGGDNVISPVIQNHISEQVQKHLNILCNEIFAYKNKNWKETPDYSSSLERYQNWISIDKRK